MGRKGTKIESTKINAEVYETFKQLADACLDPKKNILTSFKVNLDINLIIHDAVVSKTAQKIKTFEYANFKKQMHSPVGKLITMGGLSQTIPLEFGVESIKNRQHITLRQVLPIHIPRQNFPNKSYEYDLQRSSIIIRQYLATTDKDLIEEKIYEFQKFIYEFLFTNYNALSVIM